MKVVALGEAKNDLSAYVKEAQHGRILVTRHGKPAAVIVGVEGAEFEDILTQSDPAFWAMIEGRRRRSDLVPAADARKRLGIGPRKPRKPKRH